MRKFRLLFVITFFLVSVFVLCNGKRKVNVGVVKASEQHNAVINVVPYYLPKTVFKIDIEIEKKVKKVGPFYRYSEKFLNLSDVVTSNEESYCIKSIMLTSVGKTDYGKSFLIKMEGDGDAQNVTLTENGVLCGINVDSYSVAENQDNIVVLNDIEPDDVTFDGVPYLEKLLVKTSTAAMAEEAASYIYKIRKRKMKIFTSDFENLPPDGVSYVKVDEELDILERQFVELFAGKIVSVTKHYVVEYEPGLQGDKRNVLFRFSEKNGILDRMDLSGTPVYIEVENLEVKMLPEGVFEKKHRIGNQGLFFINPGLAKVKIIDKNIPIIEKEVQVSQFGQLLSLPSEILKKEAICIKVSPVTGALLNIGVLK
ncbi:MAG: DUF4831 family protein [Marinilabiliaceae bacterium]|nr:DUF4831 family protein [Marinilabiliaceae bacterium]